MKSKRTPPGSTDLPPAARDLLAHERAPLPVADDVRARVLARANEAVRLGPPTSSAAPPRAISSRALVTAAAGVAVIAGVVLALRPTPQLPAPPAVVSTPSAPAPAPTRSSTPEPVAAPPAATVPSASASHRGRAAASTQSEDGIDELSLLTRARQADARGDFATVLELVTQHAQRHATGRLAEEREVLRVKALVGLGRQAQARRAAARFRQQFPRSVLRQTVDEMVPSAP